MAQSYTSIEQRKTEGMGSRVTASIITVFGFVIALILWTFFYAGGYNAYQNVAVVMVMILAFVGIMGATWASWGIRQNSRQERTEEQQRA